MWLTIFAATLVVAICLNVAAHMVQNSKFSYFRY